MQPEEAPKFDQSLVGKRIEVLWKYFDKESNTPRMIWWTGTVKRIVDGLTDKRSPRARKPQHPAGRRRALAGRGTRMPDPDFDEHGAGRRAVAHPAAQEVESQDPHTGLQLAL